MKLILVACGTALATSTVVARKIETIAREHGIVCRTIQAKATEAFKKSQELHPDAIVCTCQLEGESDIPIINGRAFLTGINIQSTVDRLIDILKK